MRILFLIIAVAFSLAVEAQTVTFHEQEQVRNLIWSYRTYNQKRDMERGYRYHITFTNNREEAYATKTRILKTFPDLRGYVVYEQPYYKIRVGDFRTKEDAKEYSDRIISSFPGSFLVNDFIKIK